MEGNGANGVGTKGQTVWGRVGGVAGQEVTGLARRAASSRCKPVLSGRDARDDRRRGRQVVGCSAINQGSANTFPALPVREGQQCFRLFLGIVPTFGWRASAEGKLLTATFGEGYARYRKQTKMIIPRLL